MLWAFKGVIGKSLYRAACIRPLLLLVILTVPELFQVLVFPLRLRVPPSSRCLSLIALPCTLASSWQASQALKADIAWFPSPSFWFMPPQFQETLLSYLSSELSLPFTNQCTTFYQCWHLLTWACPLRPCLPCSASSGSMPGRSPLMLAWSRCTSFMFSQLLSQLCCWPWPLTAL